MFVNLVEKCGRYKYKVKIEYEVLFVFYSDLKRYGIKEGQDIACEKYESLIKETIIPRAKKKTLDLLLRADCSEAVLRRKLRLKGFPEYIVEEAINYAKRFNYINDERYAENYIKYKGNTKSLRQIKIELISKGVDRKVIGAAVSESTDDEALERLIKKKVKKFESMDEAEIRKLYAYLYRRGFDSELILSKIKELRVEENICELNG